MGRGAMLVLAGAVLGGAIGAAAGRRSEPSPAPRDREAAALRQKLAHAERVLREQGERLEGLTREHVERASRAAGHVPAEAPAASSEVIPPEKALAESEELLAAIEGMLKSPDLYREEVLGLVQEKLREELARNPRALEWALQKFRNASGTDADVTAQLSVVLGGLKDPAVESAALDLARGGASRDQRLAGLELLDRLDLDSGESRAAVLDLLRTERDPAIVSGAIYALHRGVPDPAETRHAVGTLAPLASSPDVEVRRRAVTALAEWAPDATSLAPVVGALIDPAPEVRAGAAFALSQTRLLAPSAVAALADRVSDDQEDTAVREQAWRTLARLPLDERAHAVYARFRDRFEAAGEASEEAATDRTP